MAGPWKQGYLGEVTVSNINIATSSTIEVLRVRMNPFVNELFLAMSAQKKKENRSYELVSLN